MFFCCKGLEAAPTLSAPRLGSKAALGAGGHGCRTACPSEHRAQAHWNIFWQKFILANLEPNLAEFGQEFETKLEWN